MPRTITRRLIGRTSNVSVADGVILMYHRVDAADVDPWRLAVHPSHFDEHLEVICELFQPVSLARFASAFAAGGAPRGSVVVTFDDGYRDNLLNARPLLEKHGVPASLFVTTGYLDSGRDFWWEELLAVCVRGGFDVRSQWVRLRHLHRRQRELELEALWLAAGVAAPPAPSHTMTSDEIAELATGEVFEIGAHTSTHPSLPHLGFAEQVDEIHASKTVLEALLARRVSAFSYPHGEFARSTVRAVRAEGFGTACTTSDDVLTRRSRPLELPRMHALDWTGAELEEQLSRRFGSR
jgi:peptidoglycan/xylan/chitin deacetylase (PgdA/CDA1 family)